jgi:membrane-associated protein
MSDYLLALVPVYGLWLVMGVTFFSCLAVPVPASLMMMTAGGFAAADDLSLPGVILAALCGAVAGDQVGYWLGRYGGAVVLGQAKGDGKRARLMARARTIVESKGWLGVFLTRWLFSPLGPYANVVGGAARFSWPRFTSAGVAGEAVWVGLYVGLGFGFAGNLDAAMQLSGSVLGMLAAAAVAVGLGIWLFKLARTGNL